MSRQIAVRLQDEIVDRIDDLVREGVLPSRAAFVSSALEHEFRRRLVELDIQILDSVPAGEPVYPDLEPLTDWASGQRPDLD